MHCGASIGPGLNLPHPNGIVVGAGVRIGARCRIYQQVTLGARSGERANGEYPTLGDDVVIYPGAKLIGAVTVGNGAVVGANAVVTKDVPAFHTAYGIPAVMVPIATDKPVRADARHEEARHDA